MFSFKPYRIAAGLLAITMLLSGCTLTERLDSNVSSSHTDIAHSSNVTQDGQPYFGLAYNSSELVNPVTSASKINRLLIEALYEGLFELDETFTPQPVLCDTYSTDGTHFTFHLKSGVTFWSGEPLTAQDVVYTYQLAQKTLNCLYYSRMQQVKTISASDTSTVQITLKEPNSQFINLLEIPIFRKGTESNTFSEGTGPYQPQSDGSQRWLIAYANWHKGALTNFPHIDLVSTVRADASIYSFETGDVSLTRADRISANPATIKGAVEIYQAPSTRMQYLGVNYGRAPYQISSVRQAISAVIDRQSLCTTQLQTFADPAVLPVNPQPPVTESLSYSLSSDNEKALSILASVGITDTDGDGLLDYPDNNGKRQALRPSILVNQENTFKVAAAEQIVKHLESIGIAATMNAVNFEEYQAALNRGNYDLFFAETQLSPDFDLRPILGTGGALAYGGCANVSMDGLLAQYRAATGDALTSAKQTLYTQLLSNMPIIPLAFIRSQIIVRGGFINGYTCAPDNAFYHIQDWKLANYE